MEEFPEKEYSELLGRICNFLSGFFVVPFIIFLGRTSVLLVKNPETINEGQAIIFVALITAIIYILKKDVYILLNNMKRHDWLEIILGLSTFCGLVYWF